MTDKLFLSRITDRNSLGIAEPYIVYHCNADEQEKILYFPLIDKSKNKVVYLVEAIGVNGKYICNSLDHMVEALNDIRYLDNQCIVYLLNSDIYLETTSKIINVTEYYSPETSKYISVNDEKIMSRTFEEKKEDINERFNILYDFKKYEWESEEEILNTKMYGTLILSNPQGQYQYNMCWASAVATVHNYLISKVTNGFEVCTRMGIGYNDGATIYDTQDALAQYNIIYDEIRLSPLTWTELTGNINVSKPIIINGLNSEGAGHAVTIYGYVDTRKTVQVWNSFLNSGSGGYATFTYDSGYFTNGDGVAYFWISSLSYQ